MQPMTSDNVVSSDLLDAMRAVTTRIWLDQQQEDLSPDASPGVSWVGFYASPGFQFIGGTTAAPTTITPAHDEMLLICREPKPACSPIGLHGKCGHCHLTANAVIVRDISSLSGGVDNDGYIACDPNDRSELVIPCLNRAGNVYAVLDLDSYQPHAFNEQDVSQLNTLLLEAGLTCNDQLQIDRF